MIPLALVACVTAGYLGYATLTGSPIAGCESGQTWDCDHVTKSQWSSVLLVPVSLPGAAVYAGFLAGVGLWLRTQDDLLRGRLGNVLVFLCLTAVASGLWFTGLQVFYLHKLCKWCLVVHAMGGLLLILVCCAELVPWRRFGELAALAVSAVGLLALTQAYGPIPQTFIVEEFDSPAGNVPPTSAPELELEPPTWDAPVADVAVFDAPVADFEMPAQPTRPVVEVSRPRTVTVMRPIVEQPDDQLPLSPAEPDAGAFDAEPVVPVSKPEEPALPSRKSADAEGNIDVGPAGDQLPIPTQTPLPDEPAAAPEGEAKPPKPSRYVQFGGQALNMRLNVYDRPILGDPEAPVVFMELFDYTCGHCRELNHCIDELRARMGEQLAILIVPVPLSNQCNPYVTSMSPQHADACEIARLAIAVWRLNPAAFEEYHRWLSSPPEGRTAAAARLEAERLVDPDQLRAILASNYVAQFLNQHATLYKMAGAGIVPKLYSDKIGITGQVSSVEDLIGRITAAHGINTVGNPQPRR